MQLKILEDKVRARSRPRRDSRGRVGGGWRAYDAKSRVYIFLEGETIFENLQERRSRPHGLYRGLVLAAHPELAGMRWSQTAGCGCGCSPGFIVNHTMRVDGQPVDYFITVADINHVRPAPEPTPDESYLALVGEKLAA